MLKASFAGIALRAATLASKFILVLYMARYLTPEELGIYGMITVTVALSLFVLGMDFWRFNTREILARNEAERTPLIRDQLVFHLIIYVLALPLLLVIFVAGFIPWQFVGWFYVILVLEHLSQEAFRLFVVFSRPIVANLIFFFRSGAWIYAVLGVSILGIEQVGLTTIILGWMVGQVTSLLIAGYFFRHLDWSPVLRRGIDWGWIGEGARKSAVLLGMTLFLQVMQFVDRFFIQHYHGEALVGVYTFYASAATVVQTFVFTGVVMILLPKIVEAYEKGEFEQYRHFMKKLSLGILAGAIALSMLAALVIYPVIAFVGKAIYVTHLSAYFILLGATFVLLISYIPYYALYVRKKDRELLLTALFATIAAIVANMLLVEKYVLIGASLSFLIAAIVLNVSRYAFMVRLRNE